MGLLNKILGGGVGAILSPIKDILAARQDAKNKKAELDNAIQTKKLEGIQNAENADQALSIAQVNSSGWRDEFFTIMFSLPLVMAFIPSMVGYVNAGFAVLATMPVWYKAFLGAAVGSAFGLRTVDKAYSWWNS